MPSLQTTCHRDSMGRGGYYYAKPPDNVSSRFNGAWRLLICQASRQRVIASQWGVEVIIMPSLQTTSLMVTRIDGNNSWIFPRNLVIFPRNLVI